MSEINLIADVVAAETFRKLIFLKLLFLGCQERSQGRSKGGSHQEPQKEGRRRWWQGQKEEVVQGKDKVNCSAN